MKITVFGVGYVGLVTGACFAEVGNDVICCDVDVNKINMLQNGQLPIWEPGLDDIVKRNSAEGRLVFTVDVRFAVESSLYLFIAVGTPQDEDGSANLQYVLEAAQNIGKHINEYKIIIDKSTVPVGTADKVRIVMSTAIKERGMKLNFDIVSNPEFLKEGSAILDFMKPDRIVIGIDNSEVGDKMTSLYTSFNMMSTDKVILMSVRSAEMTKYAANAMLATKISFINEISVLCEKLGADISDVRHGIGSDSRIGYKFIYPGVGYGGSCFPKDIQALIHMAKQAEMEPLVLEAVEERNVIQKRVLFDKIVAHYGENLIGRRFSVWGLSFKPQTDDMREAPSIVIINALLKAGAFVTAYDPVAQNEAKRIFAGIGNLDFADNQYNALIESDGLLLITEWHQFRNPDFLRIKELMKSPIIFDGRNIYDPKHVKDLGFQYFGIGRNAI